MPVTVALALLLLAASCVEMGYRGHRYKNGTVPRLFGYDLSDVSDVLERSGVSSGASVAPSFAYRDSRGDRISLLSFGTPVHAVVFGPNGAIARVECPGWVAYLDDEMHCAAWQESGEMSVHLKGGKSIKAFPNSLFTVDPAGEFVWVQLGVTVSEVVSIQEPEHPLLMTNLLPDRLFVRRDGLYLFGPDGAGSSFADVFDKAKDGGWVRRKRTRLGDARAQVLDLDPLSSDILIRDERDAALMTPGSTWRLLDLETGRARRLGEARDFGFFLSGSAPLF